MTLMTAHRILIATAIVFFVVYAVWEAFHTRAGGGWALVRSAIALLVAVGFGIYFRSLGKS
ncbi:MAG: hypothetical protein HYT86_03350 [candidate division NC10 bacterium]|nr:hypothetical protein [candidate division NC10 bacterium]